MTIARRSQPFGRFTLLHRIAVGGSAEVFLAHDPSRRHGCELLVVKRLRDTLCGEQRFTSMFIDEKRVISRLEHPNIVRLLEYGREGLHYFLVLEHVWGESVAALAKLCRRRHLRFPAGAALYIGAKVAEALDYAHSLINAKGAPSPIIHRDVTLGNVAISYEGDIKVLDFGIAKAEGRLTQTCAGQIKGTLSYLSPEQLRQEPVGQRTDIYQLGIFLYKLLVGFEPYQAASEADLIDAVGRGELIAPSKRVPGFPLALERVLLKALAYYPEQRFTSAAELGEALRTLLGPTYLDGRPRLAGIMAYVTGDRRQRQESFIKRLVAGLEVDGVEPDLLRWSKEEIPTDLDVELATGDDTSGRWASPTDVIEIEPGDGQTDLTETPARVPPPPVDSDIEIDLSELKVSTAPRRSELAHERAPGRGSAAVREESSTLVELWQHAEGEDDYPEDAVFRRSGEPLEPTTSIEIPLTPSAVPAPVELDAGRDGEDDPAISRVFSSSRPGDAPAGLRRDRSETSDVS